MFFLVIRDSTYILVNPTYNTFSLKIQNGHPKSSSGFPVAYTTTKFGPFDSFLTLKSDWDRLNIFLYSSENKMFFLVSSLLDDRN